MKSETLTRCQRHWVDHGPGYQKDLALRRTSPKKDQDFRQQENLILQSLDALFEIDRVLEIGCGFGRITRMVHDKFKPLHYLALDISEAQLDQARESCSGLDIEFREGIIERDLPGIPGPFDLVVAVEVLMHIPPDPIPGILGELLRLGGSLLLVNVSMGSIRRKKADPTSFEHDYRRIFQEDHGLLPEQIREIPLMGGRQVLHLVVR